MLYLLGAVLCNGVLGQSYKYAVVRGYKVDWVCVFSFCASALLLVSTGGLTAGGIDWFTVALGAGLGLASGVAQLTFFRAMRHGPLSTSYAIVALSTLLPTLASILFWHEQPTVLQMVAICAAMVAVALMQEFDLSGGRRPWAWAGWVGLSFLASGMTGVVMKMFTSQGVGASQGVFLLASYCVSGLMTLPLVKGSRPSWREATVGVLRGSAVLAANVLLLRALAVLPGYLVFSCYGAAIIALNVLAAMRLWRERPHGRAVPGIALAIISMVLLNI